MKIIIDLFFIERRPDILIKLKDYYIIIEIDEHQHKKTYYDFEDERIDEICKDLGSNKCIFIRFNPAFQEGFGRVSASATLPLARNLGSQDKYKKDKKFIKSCFNYDDSRNLIIVNETDWNNRLNVLKDIIDFYINNIPTELTVVNLFYNEN